MRYRRPFARGQTPKRTTSPGTRISRPVEGRVRTCQTSPCARNRAVSAGTCAPSTEKILIARKRIFKTTSGPRSHGSSAKTRERNDANCSARTAQSRTRIDAPRSTAQEWRAAHRRSELEFNRAQRFRAPASRAIARRGKGTARPWPPRSTPRRVAAPPHCGSRSASETIARAQRATKSSRVPASSS